MNARWLAFLVAAGALTPAALGAPQIGNVSPRGLTIGQPTVIAISGSDLGLDTHLVLPAKSSAQIKPGAKADRIEIEVTVDPSVPAGLYPLRVANGRGISSPVMIGVDRLPQVPFNSKLGDLPVAMHGSIPAGQVLSATLEGKKGQRLVIDIEAQRLGSALKPVARLYDARGAQIAWSPPSPTIGGDARIDTVLPADATYTLELHDQLYKANGPTHFRVKLGDLDYADFALPLAVTAGTKQPVKFASSNLTASPETDATSITVPGETVAALPASERFSGAAPRLAVSDFAEVVEAPAAEGKLQDLPAAPVGISGVLAAQGEEDKYQLAVTPGQKLRLDVVARQFGSPVDGVVSIRNAQGGQLAGGDDRPGSLDPMVEFTVPAGVNQVQVAIKDMLGRGGSEFVYRLAIRDVGRPDFSLSLPADSIVVPAGGTQVVPVQVTRTNYSGPIELSLVPMPAELRLAGNVIPPGATTGLLTVSAQDVSPLAVLTQVVGKAHETQPPLVRPATFGEVPGSRYQPRIRSEVGLAIAQPSPISLAWTPSPEDKLFLGGKLAAKVQLARKEGTAGNVRVRLLTTQPTPKKTIKENNQDKVVDAPEKALRLEGDPVFTPEKAEAQVTIVVPPDLPQQTWDLVLVADLLSADGKSAVASIAAPVQRLATALPFTLELVGPAAAEGKAGAGETGKLTGKVVRAPGYSQPVLVTLDGLPKGYSAPEVLVPADQSEFALPLTFAFGNKPGDLKAKLVALAAPVTAESVKSNALDVAIKVVPGEKPTAEQPKEVFDDDEKFIALLTEGGGRAIPEMRDKYSGTYSLRVTPDQRFNANLPNLGVKIRENPGPGEFRYLRFAWKKTGGNSICLQLNHDGMWGPGGSGREGAKFRYSAGPGGEAFGASLILSNKLPAKFEVVTRDLFADFGEFTLTGLAFAPIDGNAALFDHIYLGRQEEDFTLLKVK